MNILLTVNKTYRGQVDGSYWNMYLPLIELGHNVYWYDTVNPEEKDYKKIIKAFKPDLIFCCMTGDPSITPYEPWDDIIAETNSGRTTTFNWFCDDTWRFSNFSRNVCNAFNVCSTPEPHYIQKYKDIGYDNIILGCWHINGETYPRISFEEKNIDLLFIGYPTNSRKEFFKMAKTNDVSITNIYGVPHEEMLAYHAKSRIGINLSTNDNDPERKTQMKQRMFEIPAGGGLLLTQHHEGIESFYEIDKEIVTFNTYDEFIKKAKFLVANPKVAKAVANNGHARFLLEHESKIRLKDVLEKITTC